jgi:hypothetical protein
MKPNPGPRLSFQDQLQPRFSLSFYFDADVRLLLSLRKDTCYSPLLALQGHPLLCSHSSAVGVSHWTQFLTQSEDCQRTAWPAHKRTCAPPTESAPVPIDPIAVPEGIEEEVERMRALIEEVGVLQKQYMQARKGAAAASDQVTPKTYLDDARAKLAGTSYSVIRFARSLILRSSIRRFAWFRVYAA